MNQNFILNSELNEFNPHINIVLYNKLSDPGDDGDGFLDTGCF